MAKAGQGQTLNDRLNAARYALAGQGLARVVCKATTEEIIGPKKKHLDYLLQCTHEPNVSIPQLANLLIERTNHSSWVVVFKSLITVHYLMCYGNENFTQYLASNSCNFQFDNLLDRCSLKGHDMLTYIKRYSKYIDEKVSSYRTVSFDFAKIKQGKKEDILHTMPPIKLLNTLTVLQSQIDGLLEFDCPADQLTNEVLHSTFMLLFKDLIRLFACYNDGIIILLEKFFDMNQKRFRDVLEIYTKFLICMDRSAQFMRVAECIGIDKSEIPNLSKTPSSLLETLEQHLQAIEDIEKGKSKDAQPSSDGISTNSSTISAPSNAELPTDELKEALEEEIQMLNQLKHEFPPVDVNADGTNSRTSPLNWKQEGFLDGISQKQQSNQDDLGDETKILDQVTLLNKDTGECRSLSQADDILPKCINPLNPHLSKLANDYQSDEDESQPQASEEPTTLEEGDEPGTTLKTSAFKIGVKKLGKFGHGFIKGVKNVRGGALGASEGTLAVASGTTSSDTKFYRDSVTIDPRILNLDPHDLLFPSFKLKTNRKKDAADFEGLRLIQELNDCRGAVWCMKWSSCGQLLAVAGQDQLLRVYCSHKSWKHFTQARSKASSQQISPNSTKEKSVNNSRNNSISSSENVHSLSDSRSRNNLQQEDNNSLAEEDPLLLFSVYRGHTADVLDISWSKNNFLLSSSMDKTVKLWHITRVECLCTFCHKDFVSTINFHPRDDRYFLSGSLDGVLRLWNIPDKRLTLFNEVMAPSAASQKSSNKSNQEMTPSHGLITASAFVENGKFAVIGTYDGRVIFYSTDQLKYSTQIHVSGGKNVSSVTDTERKKKRNSNKVTGIEGVAERKILVTTNDSRIRLYDLRDLTLECKYKGCVNYSSQIRASVSPDNKYIVCGSENSSFYVWRTREETTTGQRRDRNAQWECVRLLPPSPQAQQSGLNSNNVGPGQASKNQPAIVTSATFAPIPSYLDDKAKYIIAVADFSGSIKVFAR